MKINPYEIGLSNLRAFEEKQKLANNMSDKMKQYLKIKKQDLQTKSKKFKV